jgi:hypothetical protein
MGVREVLLATGEIAALCDVLDVAPPLMLPRSPGQRADAASLESRGLLATGAPWHAALAVLADPDVVVTVHRRGGEGARYVLLAASTAPPMRAALHQPLTGDLHRIAALDVLEVPELAVAVAGLTERPDAGDTRLTMTAADFRAARDRASAGDADGAVAVLRGAGAPTTHAHRFGAALQSVDGAASVTVLERSGGTRVVGVAVGWLDAGEHGLWQVDGANVGAGPDASAVTTADWYRAPVVVTAVTAHDVRAQVLEAFTTSCGGQDGLGRSVRP